MKFLMMLIFLCGIRESKANLYNCDETTGKPVASTFSKPQELIFSKTQPFLKDNKLNYQNLKSKTPFLIYYSIDSSEAFMQYTVRYEISKLQESCSRNTNVNFVGLINSLLVEKNQILVCKAKKISYINLSQYPSLNEKLIKKRKFISSGDHTSDELGPLSYLVLYAPESNKPFGQYPLAHPDYLHDLISFVITDKTMFPNDKYAPFINLKSHGSKNSVLAGMHECQSKAKKLSADKIIKNILTKKEIKYLNDKNEPTKIIEDISTYENIIRKLDLGENSGVGSSSNLGNDRLGNDRLSFNNNGLGNAISGLGVHEGLGAEFSFGTSHPQLNWVLQDLFESDSKMTLGFLMLESCDTNRNPELFHSYLDNVLGYYSAQKSLWYRNLNWWDILERAEGSSDKLVEILKIETANIPNIEVLEK